MPDHKRLSTQQSLARHKQPDDRSAVLLHRLELAHEITLAMSEQRDLSDTVSAVLSHLISSIKIDACAGGLFRDNEFEIIAREPKDEPVSEEMEVGSRGSIQPGDPFDQMRSTRKAVFLANPTKDPRYAVQPSEPALLGSGVLVPLVTAHSVSGFLVVARKNLEAFDQEEIDFLEHLGIQIGTAVHQRALYTDLHEAYEELRASQKREMRQERLHAMGQIASSIVHDVNNALSPIVIYSDLLLRNPEALSEKVRKDIRVMQSAGREIGTIVERLRQFYRDRDADEEFAVLQINDLVTEAIEMGRPRWEAMPEAGSGTVTLATELAEDVPLLIGNGSEIRHTIANLLFNALDAIPDGGTVTVRSTAEADVVAVEISDTGVGMDAETLRQCTEPFFTTKGARGTGMGLATSHGVTQRHGGALEVESELGVGTTVRLRFPVQDRPGDIQAARAGSFSRGDTA